MLGKLRPAQLERYAEMLAENKTVQHANDMLPLWANKVQGAHHSEGLQDGR